MSRLGPLQPWSRCHAVLVHRRAICEISCISAWTPELGRCLVHSSASVACHRAIRGGARPRTEPWRRKPRKIAPFIIRQGRAKRQKPCRSSSELTIGSTAGHARRRLARACPQQLSQPFHCAFSGILSNSSRSTKRPGSRSRGQHGRCCSHWVCAAGRGTSRAAQEDKRQYDPGHQRAYCQGRAPESPTG